MNENSNYVVTINKKDFFVEQDEFMEIKNERFSNLKILKDVEKYERITGLLNELSKVKSINTSPNINTHCKTVPLAPAATRVSFATPVENTVSV
jgi:hypothetical protein